jgi:RNA polymerase sigma-70 factor, ECF subfamily
LKEPLFLKPREPDRRSNPAWGGPYEDLAYVERARQGDESAFEWLVERHRDRAFGLALRILRSRPDAEDAAQEAFVRAWQALPRFRGESSFSTWLYRIVARQSFDRLQTLKRRRERETVIEAAVDRAAGESASDEAAWRARQVERLIDRLSPVQRAVVTLFYFQDRSVEQVAEALAMPENTVKTHLSRARAEMRQGWPAGGDERR